MEKYRVAKNLDMTEKMLVDKDNHISEYMFFLSKVDKSQLRYERLY
jgi:hypothetical protein